MARGVQGIPGTATATIPNGQAVSGSIFLGGSRIGGIHLPAAWTAADLTFEARVGSGVWAQVWDDANSEVLIAAATIAARLGDVIVPTLALGQELEGLNEIRLVSGNTAANVNQAADRAFYLILKS